MKKTPWFDGSVKPVHECKPGEYYERDWNSITGYENRLPHRGYFRNGRWEMSDSFRSMRQSLPWRGWVKEEA